MPLPNSGTHWETEGVSPIYLVNESSGGRLALREVFLVTGNPVIVGRGSNFDDKGRVPDTNNAFYVCQVLSLKHAAFTIDGVLGPVCVVDQNSTHGTFLNGVKLSAFEYHKIRHGDTLTFGRSVVNDDIVTSAVTVKVLFDNPRTSQSTYGLTYSSSPSSVSDSEKGVEDDGFSDDLSIIEDTYAIDDSGSDDDDHYGAAEYLDNATGPAPNAGSEFYSGGFDVSDDEEVPENLINDDYTDGMPNLKSDAEVNYICVEKQKATGRNDKVGSVCREHMIFKNSKKRKADALTDDAAVSIASIVDSEIDYDSSALGGPDFMVGSVNDEVDRAVSVVDSLVDGTTRGNLITPGSLITPVDNGNAPSTKRVKTELGFTAAAGAIVGALATYSFLLSPIAASLAA